MQIYSPIAQDSLRVSGSLSVSGSVTAQSFTGSFSGTASYAANALTSSYALTASVALNVPATASYAMMALTASYANFAANTTSASFAVSAAFATQAANASSASFASNASTAASASFATQAANASSASYALSSSYATASSFAFNATTASYALSASYATASATAISASFATNAANASSASYALNSSNTVSASYSVSSSYAISSSYATASATAISASYAVNASTATSASFATNASTAASASYATNAGTAGSASYATTASYATASSFASSASYALNASNAVTASHALNAVTTSYALFTANATSASYALSSSYAYNSSVAISSSFATNASTAASASYATQANTASSADNFNVRGTLTATNIVVQTITSSVSYLTGSTRFGSDPSVNTHTFSGSLLITGSITVSNAVTNNLTASWAVWANNAVLATNATSANTASWATNVNTSSWANNATSASYALNASNATSASFATSTANATSASIATNAVTASYASTINGVSTSYIPVSTATNTLGNSILFQSSSRIGLNTLTPATTLALAGSTSTIFGLSLEPSGWNSARHRWTVHTSGDTSMWSFNWNGSAVDSALYSVAAINVTQGVISFSTTGSANAPTERMRVDSVGNVGIGTTTVGGKLHVVGTESRFGGVASGFISIYNATGRSGYIQANGGTDLRIASDSDPMTLYVNSSERVRIDGNGNVGIGTNSPIYPFNVVIPASGSKQDLTNINRAAGNFITFTNPQYSTIASIGLLLRVFPQSDARQGAGIVVSGGTNNAATDLSIFTSTSPDGLASTSSADLTITGNNKFIGIGTTIPTAKLDVRGSVQIYTGPTPSYGASGGITISDTYDSVKLWDSGGGADNGTLDLYTQGIQTVRIIASGSSYISGSGSVGIGSTSPQARFQVVSLLTSTGIPLAGYANSSSVVLFTNADPSYGTLIGTLNTGTGWIQQQRVDTTATTYPLLLNPNGGSVGIGTTAPGAKFEVYGNEIRIDSTGTKQVYLRNVGGSGTGSFIADGYLRVGTNNATNLDLITNNTSRVVVDTSGNVGIGSSAPTQKLDVNGYIRLNSGIVLNGVTSSYREIVWNTNAANRWDLYMYGSEGGSNTGGDLYLANYADNGAYLGNVMTFNRSNGSVGIGTTAPASLLHVEGNIRIGGSIYSAASYAAFLTPAGAALPAKVGALTISDSYTDNAPTNGLYVKGSVGLGRTPASNEQLAINVPNSQYAISFYSGSSQLYGLHTNNNIFSFNGITGSTWYFQSGNVGIGTTPTRKLDVNGTSIFRDFTTVVSSNGNTVSNITWLSTDSGIMNIYTGGSATVQLNSSGVSYFNGGNVGIGTISPTNKLHVNGGYFLVNNNVGGDGNSGLRMWSTVATTHYNWMIGAQYNISGFEITPSTATGSTTFSTPAFVINSSNSYVGIGTASPANRLQIGSVGSTGYSGNDIAIGNGTQVMAFYQASAASYWYTNTNFALLQSGTGNGNVGINTTAPAYKLHVVGSIYTSTNLTTAGSITIGMSPAPFWNAKFTDYSDGSGVYIGSVQAGGYKYISGESYYNNSSFWYSDKTTSTAIGLGDGILRFYTDSGLTANTNFIPSERMRIAADGNVGIGTSVPQRKLHVYRSGGSNYPYIQVDPGPYDAAIQFTDGTNNVYAGMMSGSTNLVGAFTIWTGGNARVNVLSGGSVGIGTTSISSRLSIKNDGASDNIIMNFLMTNGSNAVTFRTTDSPVTFGIHSQNSGDIYIKDTTDNVWFYGKSGGNVGIGTTAPLNQFHVQGSGDSLGRILRVTSTSPSSSININHTANGGIIGYANTGATGNLFYITTGAGTIGSGINMDNNGLVGITTTSPSSLLHIYNAQNWTAASLNEVTSSAMAFKIKNRNGTNGQIVMGSMGNTSNGQQAIDGTSASDYVINPFGGNVGIGTTSPGYKLHVEGAGALLAVADNTSYTTGVGGAIYLTGNYRSVGDLTTAGYMKGSKSNSTNGDYGFDLVFGNQTYLVGVTEKMRITSNGNLGIGTATPTAKLHIEGNNIVVNTEGSAQAKSIYFRYSNEARIQCDSYLTFYTAGSPTEKVRIEAGGNVGIGTTAPRALLDVAGGITGRNSRTSTSQRMPVGHYTPGETVFEIDPTWTQAQLQDYFNSTAVTWTASADAPGGYAIRIDGSVNVGGNAYSSGFPFIPVDSSQDDWYYMECYIKNEAGSTIQHYMGGIDHDKDLNTLGGNPGSYTYNVMFNYNPGTSWTKVYGYWHGFGGSYGSSGTGNTNNWVSGTKYFTPQALFNYTTSAGTSRCYISGWKCIRVRNTGNRYFSDTIYAGGDVVAYYSSDARLKDNVIKIDSPLEKIMKLNGYTFNWNDKQAVYQVGKQDLGVIAQEVEEVLPEIVETRNSGYKAVKYEKLVPLLIEAIKELKAEIDELKNNKQ